MSYSFGICVEQVNENTNNMVMVKIQTRKIEISCWLKINLNFV
jgi:hypothetical protein